MANERYENSMAHAPMEIFSAVRKNYAFAIEDALSYAGAGDDSNQPVKLHASYSRFRLAVIQDGKYATANLDVRDFPGIRLRSEEAVKNSLSPAAAEPEGASPAYTVKISVGKHKGKTPAQIMSESGDEGAKELNGTYKWLKDNYDPESKYAESNRAQMDAIAEAAKLYKAGTLKNASSGGAVTIYESGFRPLMKRAQKNGKNFVYEYSITYVPGNMSPVKIEIQNYYAEVAKKDDGRLNVFPSTKEDAAAHTAYLTDDEWLWALHMMEVTLQSFELQNAPRARQYCLEREKQNMEAARGAAS